MKKILRILAFFLLCLPLRAATYYIDASATGCGGSGCLDSNVGTGKATAWLHAPGMAGCANNCASYSHSAGDSFIFKGGVTWDATIAPWTNSNSGSAGNIDYYGVDKTWWLASPSGSSPGCGAVWCNPIFDGGSNPALTTTENGYFIFSGSYLTMDSLQVKNIGVAGTNQGNYALVFKGSNITVENMVLPVMSRTAIFYTRTGNASNITFSGNNISACSWGIAVATSAPNTVINGVYIHDNILHDFHPQIANAVHGDGIFTYGSGAVTDATQYTTNEYIYNNTFYGDFSKADTSATGMTAFMYFSQTAGPVYIFNNHGTDSASFSGFACGFNYMNIYPTGGNVYVYNNSFLMDTASSGWEGFISGGFGSSGTAPNITAENNIYEGGQTVYSSQDATTSGGLVSNYNDFYAWALNQFANLVGTIGGVNYSTFKSDGFETNGLNANPLFVSSTNLQLQAGSPAIGTGYNLSAVFTTDAIGNTWVPPWSMGAYAPEPVASLSTSSFAFSPPSYGTGVTSAAQTVTVTNAGNLNLTFTTAALSGTNSADFSISADTCVIGGVGQTIAPLGTCTVSVTFTPSIIGAETATLSLASNDPLSPATVSLSGTGSSGALPSLSTSSLTWAGQVVGTTQSVTLTNTGNTTLTISSITISGSQFAFTGSNTCGSTLASLAACTITVAPAVNGNPATTSFTVTGNGTPATVSATLAASGIVPGAATTAGGTAGIQ